MCKEVIVDGNHCSNYGELKEQIGGAAVFDERVEDMTDNDCLCGLDVKATAEKYGLVIEEENGWETILRHAA